jgi:hypothetical protein
MNDNYQKMSELLDNWLSFSSKEVKMALIEKEILLEKMRRLYVHVSNLETEEYTSPKHEVVEIAQEPAPKKEYTRAKTLEEDVDLFFDTEHESYEGVAQELKELAEEIEAQEPVAPTPEQNPETRAPETDVFDRIEKEEPAVEEDSSDMHDDAEELFEEADIEITAPADTEEEHVEDDILQFIPPKSSPAPEEQPVPQKPEPATPVLKKQVTPPTPQKPVTPSAPNKPATPPVPQKPVAPQKPMVQSESKRSLNDLFNEQREDHSISSQYRHAKVGDLTKAISINDKFIYIKELFHNRGEDFSASIRRLNECKSMDEAFDCLEELKQTFFWDSKSDAYLSFCDLLRRKYS